MKKIITLSLFFLVSITILILSFEYGFLRFNYPARDKFPIHGLDISHHQGKIDWDLLKKQNFQFIYIKATEGGDWQDPKFAEFWKAARKRNIPIGAYHFYRICKTGIEQAKNFISTVPKVSSSLPHVVDLEYLGNCVTKKSKETIISEISDYLELIKQHYEKAPIIYSTEDFYNQYLLNKLMKTKMWIRNIYRMPKLPDQRQWILWQYANRGRVQGIEKNVDLNLFNGNIEQFKGVIK